MLSIEKISSSYSSSAETLKLPIILPGQQSKTQTASYTAGHDSLHLMPKDYPVMLLRLY